MSTGTALLVGLALLVGNAFFVGAEFAVISARRSSIEPLAASGNRRARTVLWAMEHVSLMLACAQLGVTVCSIGLGIVAEPALAHLFEVPLGALGVPAAVRHTIAFAGALVIVVYLHVVLGEMVPKNLAVAGPDTAVMWFGPPLVWVARVVRPLVGALDALANGFVRLCGIEPRAEVASAFTAEQVQTIVRLSQEEGVLTDDQGLLAGSIEFSERVAHEVMVPREELTTLLPGTTPDDVEAAVARTGFSRFPLVDGDGADASVVGYLHLKDVLYAGEAERGAPVPAWRSRPLVTVAPDDEVEEVLAVMQRDGAHLAVVVDGGRQAGVVFLEDIIEELVGEVRDAMQRADGRP